MEREEREEHEKRIREKFEEIFKAASNKSRFPWKQVLIGFIVVSVAGTFIYCRATAPKFDIIEFKIKDDSGLLEDIRKVAGRYFVPLNSYASHLPEGGWYDTGIWMGPDQVAFFMTTENHQPFEVKIADESIKARLDPLGKSFGVKFKNISGQDQKIFLRASDTARSNHVNVSFFIGLEPPDEIKRTNEQTSNGSTNNANIPIEKLSIKDLQIGNKNGR